MTETRETPHLTPARQAEQAARDKRLARALRANLQRRKEQGRSRADTAPEPAEAPDGKTNATLNSPQTGLGDAD